MSFRIAGTGSTKGCETSSARYENRPSRNRAAYILMFSPCTAVIYQIVEEVGGGTEEAAAMQTRRRAQSLGGCRSMDKQDWDLCTSNQSDSLKGHVSGVRARHRMTFS